MFQLSGFSLFLSLFLDWPIDTLKHWNVMKSEESKRDPEATTMKRPKTKGLPPVSEFEWLNTLTKVVFWIAHWLRILMALSIELLSEDWTRDVFFIPDRKKKMETWNFRIQSPINLPNNPNICPVGPSGKLPELPMISRVKNIPDSPTLTNLP